MQHEFTIPKNTGIRDFPIAIPSKEDFKSFVRRFHLDVNPVRFYAGFKSTSSSLYKSDNAVLKPF